MTNKAIEFAEKNLGVNTVYEEARNHRNLLDDILSEHSAMRDKRRDVEMRISDQEMEVITEQRGKHPDMAVTRWDKHIKEAFQRDPGLRSLREEMTKVISDFEGLEYDKQITEVDLKICISRMVQLGGLLNFYAAVKSTNQTTKPQETGEKK